MNKHKAGNAYIMVMIAAMAVLMVVSVAIIITARSRQVSARYGYYSGLYDLAVAGNQQVLFLLRQGVQDNIDEIIDTVVEMTVTADCDVWTQNFISAALPFAIANLETQFAQYGLRHRLEWGIEISYTLQDGWVLQDSFNAVTTVTHRPLIFEISTTVAKTSGGTQSPPVIVDAVIVWRVSCDIILGNCLDGYALEMVELMRVAD